MVQLSSPSCAVVDWGTSSFRLWLLGSDGTVIGESRSGEGMMHCARHGFPTVLDTHLAKVEAPPRTPVLICGMAGARQGWQEAPYVQAPADVNSIAQQAVRVGTNGRDIRILPGVALCDPAAPNVMRGEETQLAGAFTGKGDGLFCMPGTHSKWVWMQNGRLEHFTTFMTGELYALLTQHSILQHAVKQDGDIGADDAAFVAAVLEAQEDPGRIWSSFFGLRASQLLGFDPSGSGGQRLSGLLIGAEITAASGGFRADQEITLVASGNVSKLYEKALILFGFKASSVSAEEASRKGLFRFAQQIWGFQT